ncbi:hypothetical protein J3R82DRAFT_7493 [Butyriboletus roseoflavus]|nr:hypothetical protein J3R82DRAFT_7493 [Butyriboletus roseoflavus]
MDLPAVERLGYALNLSEMTPFDIGAVEDHILYQRHLLRIDFSDVRDVVIDGEVYSVPRQVLVQNDNQIVRGEYITFPNGTEAASAFRSDASYPLRYFAVSGTTSGAIAAQKSFLADNQFAFFSYTEGKYNVRLRDYYESLVEAPLINGLEGMPNPFNPSDANTVRRYREFFRDFGSHIIVHANYGARYPLKVWASTQTPAVNTMFNTNVKAKFNGIPSGGIFDASVKAQDQYSRFSEYFQYLVTVSGGGDRSKLANIDGTYEDYRTWIDSIKENNPGLLSFQVTEIWSLMKFATSLVLRSYADPLYDAFIWLVTHPEVHKTHVSLDIQSDWAEFNLLTPSAVIIPDIDNPYPPTNTVASATRVQWGKEKSHDFDRQTLRFFVINDGSPIDFSISRGSYGMAGVGKAIVTFQNHSYTNDVITDDIWNTKWFYKAPVNPIPETQHRLSKVRYTWDDVLREYLDDNVDKCQNA